MPKASLLDTEIMRSAAVLRVGSPFFFNKKVGEIIKIERLRVRLTLRQVTNSDVTAGNFASVLYLDSQHLCYEASK